MEKIILWGTGKIANKLFPGIDDEVILVIDNDKKKWGTVWNEHVVERPSTLEKFCGKYDRIVIASVYWKDIKKQIIEEFGIEPSFIDNMYYRQKRALLDTYKYKADRDKERYILFLEQNPLQVFNDDFIQKYENLHVEVNFDQENSLYYVYHNGRKMYFSSEFSNEEVVKGYYSFLRMEQDVNSPHRYQTDCFHVNQNDVVLDAGVAEGNFALDIIDLVDKLYLVECDERWVKALKCTFAPYKDKVEIIQGMLGDGNKGSKTIDEIIGTGKVDFIKLDIEGAEGEALSGSEQTLKQNNVKLDICVYHNDDDEKKVKQFLGEMGYETKVSDGYMVFISEQFLEAEVTTPQFVRGLVRGKKKED